jgi:hypothetical protein
MAALAGAGTTLADLLAASTTLKVLHMTRLPVVLVK